MPNDSSERPRVNTQLETLIRALLSDRPIAYHAMVAKAVGSSTAGLLLSQFLYWTPRTDDPDGWFYKTQAEIADETALSRWEQETARTRLKSLAIIEEKRRGVPGKIFFRVNFARLQEVLVRHNVGIPQSTMRKNHIVESEAPASHNVGIPQSGKPSVHNAENHQSITEITPEITVVSKGRRITQSDPPRDAPSKFRKGTHQEIPEMTTDTKDQSGTTARPAPGKRPVGTIESRTGLTMISDVLTSAGIAVQRARTGQRDPAPTRRAETPRKTAAPALGEGPPPAYISNVIEDISTKLADTAHLRANITQARRLWQQSELPVDAFVRTLYDVRDTVRWQTKIDNRMAYFFKALRVALGLAENPNQQQLYARRVPPAKRTEATGRDAGTATVESDDPDVRYAVLPGSYQAQPLWDRVTARLANHVTRPTYETYIRPADQAEVVDGHLRVHVQSAFAAAWLDTKLRSQVIQAVADESGLAVWVEFVTSEALSDVAP